MKKILMMVVLVMGLQIVHAQTEKGNVIIGAQLANIGADLKDGGSMLNFTLSPKVGWFVKDDLALGARADFGVTATKGNKPFFDLGLVPFARYYFGGYDGPDKVKTARVFGELGAGFGLKSSNGVSTSGFKGNAGVGVAYFVSPTVALETSANLGILAGSGNTTVSPNINLGFQIHLPNNRVKEIRSDIRK
ncbi:MAG: hypothetical protein E6Q95_01665 [Chitinophagaceae bacterium]|nr:MAG: hypothetical protein E6Q95_01665 [Chitinophagaceae bacterium]